jgi:cohesin complex subunit SCC1
MLGGNSTLGGSFTLDQSSSAAFDLGLADDAPLADAEQLDEAHITKRTQRMMANLRAGFEEADELSYDQMTTGKTRRTAAAVLFELLVLKTKDYVDVQQPKPFADIAVTPTQLLLADA